MKVFANQLLNSVHTLQSNNSVAFKTTNINLQSLDQVGSDTLSFDSLVAAVLVRVKRENFGIGDYIHAQQTSHKK